MALRRVNWDVEIATLARDLVGQPFRWGLTDCGSLIRAGIRRMYEDGDELVDGIPTYENKADALRIIGKAGGFRKIFEEHLGAVPVRRSFLQAGDLIVLPGEDDEGVPGSGILPLTTHVMTSSIKEGVHLIRISFLPDEIETFRIEATSKPADG